MKSEIIETKRVTESKVLSREVSRNRIETKVSLEFVRSSCILSSNT